jgi:hypothetical protein
MAVQHTYRIRHKGVESTPYSLADLRQMWRAGQIDSSTEFKRGSSSVWLDVNDLRVELQLDDPASAASSNSSGLVGQASPKKPGGTGQLVVTSPVHVRVTSIRIPFNEVLVLVLKFCLAALLLALAATAAWLALARYLP